MKTTNVSLRSFIVTSIFAAALAALSVACGGDPNGAAEPTDEALTNDPDAAASASPDDTANHPEWYANVATPDHGGGTTTPRAPGGSRPSPRQ